jgi:Cu/Ag efflux protein CusF
LLALWALYKHRGAKTVSVVFVGLILVASGLLAVTGYKGGEVVYRHGGGVMRMPEISGDGGHGSHAHGEGEEHGDMPVHDSMDMKSMEDNHSGHDHGDQSGLDNMPMPNQTAIGQGIINSIDKVNRKVNLNHEAILDIGWPAMTMDLDVSEDVDLEILSLNQAVQFYMELGKDKIYRITKIIKINKKVGDGNNREHDHGDHAH